MRLGFTIDQRIAFCAVGNDRLQQQFRIGDGLRRHRLALHCLQPFRQFVVIELAEQRAADPGAERRQAIADFESGREHPRRAAARDEHDFVAIEQRQRQISCAVIAMRSSTGCSTATTWLERR